MSSAFGAKYVPLLSLLEQGKQALIVPRWIVVTGLGEIG